MIYLEELGCFTDITPYFIDQFLAAVSRDYPSKEIPFSTLDDGLVSL